ncbi:hypothetical protein ILYODFUR_005115 [Ilyodon furcidens]|uniref:Secreted protein n=1 Tax=Ilyodon furcidens TaxID=33524 RepID=A0ABV0UQC0_9TELE
MPSPSIPHLTWCFFSCHLPLSLLCRCVQEKGEVLKEERCMEWRAMNLPAICNTLRFAGFSLAFDPNLMRQESFSRSPTHSPPPSQLPQESCTTPLFLAVCP